MDQIYKEAMALKKLNHQNIVKLYHAFLQSNDLVMIMECAQGGELLEYVQKKSGLSEIEARAIFEQIVDAVYYFHERNIIHRDLKLENILFADNTNTNIKAN